MSDTHKVTVFLDANGEWRWRRMRSSDIVATSGEGYKRLDHATRMAGDESAAFGIPLEIAPVLRAVPDPLDSSRAAHPSNGPT